MECKETIAEQVDAMGLVDMSRHCRQRSGRRLQGRWTWRMRREGRWISSQCNYFLGRETNRRRFQHINIHDSLLLRPLCTGCCHYTEGGGDLKQYRRQTQPFPISLPSSPWKQLDAEYDELQRDVVHPPLRERPAPLHPWRTSALEYRYSQHGGQAESAACVS
jgi:hypothetical protein